MSADISVYLLLAVGVANLALLGWLHVRSSRASGDVGGLAVLVGGRFDAVERNNETLRRTLTEMDQALRDKIATGTRDGLAAAFDKVQQGTAAQAEQLGSFGNQLTIFRQLVAEKLAEAETRASDARAALVRDTSDAITQAREAIDNSLRAFGEQQRERLMATEQAVREGKEATEAFSTKTETALREQLGELSERVRTGFDGFSERLREQQEQLREKVETKLDEIRTGNETKLDQISRAVDEQLQSALQKGLDERFHQVVAQFAEIQQAIGQVKDVAGQIGDLKRLFSNVKMRGGVGEDHLGVLLDDFLPPGSYERNLRIAEANEVVEYAVRIPARGSSGDKWLAIDAKFPTIDYERLVQASESNDRDQEIAARKALERKIREEAKRISSKYIRPPQTLDFAIMYLPSEGLDSEVSRMPGLIDALRREYSIHVMGPRLLPAHLHCIRVGYFTLALEQKAGAIGEILSAVKAEWSKLGESLDALAKRADILNKGIRKTQQRTRVVGRTLETVDALEFERAEQVLGLSDETILIEADLDDEDGIPVVGPRTVETGGSAEPRAAE